MATTTHPLPAAAAADPPAGRHPPRSEDVTATTDPIPRQPQQQQRPQQHSGAAATAMDPPGAEAIPSTTEPSLLRTWTPPPPPPPPPTADNHHTPNSPSHHTSNSSSSSSLSSPPVAPSALVMEQADELRQASFSSYPVATFVRDWVRTSIDQINEQRQRTAVISGASRSSAAMGGMEDASRAANADETLPLSVRSEADLPPRGNFNRAPIPEFSSLRATVAGPAAAAAAQAPPHRERAAHTTAAAPEGSFASSAGENPPPPNNNDLSEQMDYILVDGDLIEIPPQPPNITEQEMMEDMVREQLQANQNLAKNCQPTKKGMRKGFKKIAKLFKRGGRKSSKEASMMTNGQQDSVGNHTALTSQPSLEQLPDTNSNREISAAAAAAATTTSSSSLNKSTREDLSVDHFSFYDSRIHLRSSSPSAAQALAGVVSPSSNDSTKKASLKKASSPKRKKDKKDKKSRSVTWGLSRVGRNNNAGGSSVEQAEKGNISGERDFVADIPPQQGLAPPSSTHHSQSTTDEIGRFAAFANNASFDGLVATDHEGLVPLAADTVAARPPPMRPIHEISGGSSAGSRAHSVTACYVGPADQLVPGGTVLLPDISVAAESFVEEDLSDETAAKKEDGEPYLPLSLVAAHADLKVDKTETPDVEAMLRRAHIETTTDLEAPNDSDCLPTSMPIPEGLFSRTLSPGDLAKQGGKTENSSVPLSQATAHSREVHNDTLKVFLVSASSVDKSWLSRKFRGSNKRPRKRTTLAVDVHEWRPYNASEADERSPVKCMVWDVQGASVVDSASVESRSNFGAHPGTQSLFFSPNSLYLLIWDLAATDEQLNRRFSLLSDMNDDDDDDDDDESDFEDDFVREEANRQADRALGADIMNRVLSWFDCIAQRGLKSAVLPVALVPGHMPDKEVQRRCEMMHTMLEEHFHNKYDMLEDALSPKLLTGTDKSILRVNHSGDAKGIERLQEMVMAIANDPSRSVFDHVGTLVPPGTVVVRDAVQKFKEEHKLILLDHLLGELGNALDVDSIIVCLHFLASIGEILYFGTNDDDVLSRYIILSRKWLISALSCILRNDLKRELQETRRFMNLQCIYSDQKYEEHEIIKALVSGKTSSCPLLSDVDANMLWQSMSFMREASDRYANLIERSATAPTMFYFLERLLVHSGVFLPLGAPNGNASLDQTEVFFVPSLLAQADPHNLWTYRSSEAFLTTLCHSWLFRDGAPHNLMEWITVRVLRDLYEFTRAFQMTPQRPARESNARVHSAPVGRTSFGEFVHAHDKVAVGCIRIHHVVCFKSSMMIKIGSVFPDTKTGDLRESFVEVFIAVVDQSSSHSVACDVMRPSMQRVVVSGKGQSGHQGRKLWKGGYKTILDSVRETLSNMSNVDSQVICPECLASSSPRIASTWGWDSVLAAAESGNPHVICLRGHRVNSNLICGTCPDRKPPPPLAESGSTIRVPKIVNINEILQSVVLIGVWDASSKLMISVGSGFVLDKKLGLVVSAAHVLFKMEANSELFGKPLLGHPNGRAVIGMIPEKEGKHAVFRYFAEIVASDVHNVDACVLQIRSRLERDVDQDFAEIDRQPEIRIHTEDMPAEELSQLKMTKHFELEEAVRVTGYNQGGEGIYEVGRHISRSVDFVGGYICRHFKAAIFDDSYSSDSSSSQAHQCFAPREEIVIVCSTISGHSGGPCISNDGKVVGILSRSDPADRTRCYLVPATEIKPLAIQARVLCTRPARLSTQQTL